MNSERDVLDGLRQRLPGVCEAHPLELHDRNADPGRQIQLSGVRLVLHLGSLGEELPEVVHVNDGVHDHIVDGPQEVQGREDVDDVGIHSHELADLAVLLQDPLRGQEHAAGEGEVDEHLLQDVQHRQRGLRRHGVLLELLHHIPVLAAFILLGGEVLDRLVVDQRIGQAVVQLVVVLGGGRPEPLAPQSDLDRGVAIQKEVEANENCQAGVPEVEHENQCDGQGLRQRGEKVQKHVLHGLLRRLDAAVHRADDVAHLLPQMPVQGQIVQVGEGLICDLDVRRLLDLDVDKRLRLL
mmetsp:Transcript_49028/g.149279  ORF Transcript_49028/g.149279 Transcript_49028/m.149279 type:complete len:296 (-) Transcript_49028:551-1438(-)